MVLINDIIGRLKTLRLNIVNSPDFNTYATNKSKELIDQVLQTFIKINMRNTSSGLTGSTSDRVINTFKLNGNHSIKNRLQILNDLNKISLAIKISPNLSSEVKQYAISRINMIAKV